MEGVPPAKWTPDEKARALEVYVAEGPAAAARATGIPKSTIKNWVRRDTATQDEQRANARSSIDAAVARRKAAMEEKQATIEESKAEMVRGLAVLGQLTVERLVEALTDPDVEISARDLSATLRSTIYNLQLLAGQATSRPDWSSADPEARRARIIELTKDLAARADAAGDGSVREAGSG